ncbi:MAG: restriction endonuclease subunit S [Bacteroidales bacterium]|nr:restriction endonuclease subunit S [Bacteroidales bacterium]
MKQGWTYKKLGEVATIVGGSTPKTSIEEYWGGTHYWVTPANLDGNKYQGATPRTITDLAVQKTNLQLLPIGTVLLSSRAPIGKVAITTVPMYCNQGFKNIVCSDLLINEFVYWYLYGKVDYLNSLGTGATFKEISKKTTEQIPIPVPSIAEQQRIVVYLDAAFAQIDELKSNAEKQLAEARALFQSALKKMLEPKEGWENDTLINVFNFIDYRGATPQKIQSGVPLVTAKNVKFGYIDYSIKDYISKEEYETRKGRGISRKGDLLFTTEAPLGNVAIADLEEFSAGQRLITLQQYDNPKYEFINEFYYYYMLSSPFQNRIMELATGATAQGIKAKLLKTIIVPIPTLSEQQSIVATLDFLKTNVNCLQENFIKISQECDALKQALLRQIFE